MWRFIKFWVYLKPFKKYIILLFLIIMITILINLPIPLIEKVIIDDAIPRADINSLLFMVALILGLYGFYHIFSYIRNYISIRFRNKVLTKVRVDIYEHLQRMSMGYFSREQSGELLSRMLNDVGFIQSLVNDEFFVVVGSLIKVGIIVFLLFKISVKLTLLCASVLPFIVIIFLIYKQRLYIDNKRLQEKYAQLSGKIQENLALMKLIQAETIEDHKTRETFLYTKDLENITIKRGMTGIKGNLLITVISNLPLYGIIWGVGGYMVIMRSITLGSLLAFMQYIFGVIGPVSGFFNFAMNLQGGYAALDRIYEILDKTPQIEDKPGAIDLQKSIFSIKFEDVTLRYPDRDHPDKEITALKNLNLEIKAGERIGIVGPSGGGKTSLINLILRFSIPNEGVILLNNIPIESYKIRGIREKIAYVSQEMFLFNDTIRNNLTLGREYNDKQIDDALRFAHAEDFVSSMKHGLDSVIGERGVSLSGGQRQRICLARVFLKRPEVFIFDEAFSSVDSKLDIMIQDTLKELIRDRIAIIIAHRFTFLQLVERVFVLSEGELVEQGSIDELLSIRGLFYKLYISQNMEKNPQNNNNVVSG